MSSESDANIKIIFYIFINLFTYIIKMIITKYILNSLILTIKNKITQSKNPYIIRILMLINDFQNKYFL